MRNLRTPFIALVLGTSAILLFAQASKVETLEKTFRPHVSQGKILGGPTLRAPETRVFQIEGASYQSGMSAAFIQASPDWTASQPTPIGFTRLEEVARKELAKVVADDSSWSVTSFQLHSIPEGLLLKWYFVVEMKPFWEASTPEKQSDTFVIYIDLSGKPGTIRRV